MIYTYSKVGIIGSSGVLDGDSHTIISGTSLTEVIILEAMMRELIRHILPRRNSGCVITHLNAASVKPYLYEMSCTVLTI